jgi:hypothetical protein
MCLFFSAFVFYSLCEQYESIQANASKIDRLKRNETKNLGFMNNLKGIFGNKVDLYWFIPIGRVPKPIISFHNNRKVILLIILN